MFGVSHKNTWVSCPTNMSVPPTQYGRSLGSSCAFLREPLSVERILFVSMYVPGPSWGNSIASILGRLTGIPVAAKPVVSFTLQLPPVPCN